MRKSNLSHKMTQDELNNKISIEMTPVEQALLNTNIYFNPKYVDYYIDYGAGRYDKCWEFLTNNRHLLTLKHTPKEHKEIAKMFVKNAREREKDISDDPVVIVQGEDPDEIYLIDDPEMINILDDIHNKYPEAEAMKRILSIVNPEKYKTTDGR